MTYVTHSSEKLKCVLIIRKKVLKSSWRIHEQNPLLVLSGKVFFHHDLQLRNQKRKY